MKYVSVTARRRRFATEFVRNGGQGTRAAVAAGYGAAGAAAAASRLLTCPAVLALIVGDCKRLDGPVAAMAMDSLQRPYRPALTRARTALLADAPAANVLDAGGQILCRVPDDVVDVPGTLLRMFRCRRLRGWLQR